MYKVCSTLGCLPWFFSYRIVLSVSPARCFACIPRRDCSELLLDGGSLCCLQLLNDFHFLNFFTIQLDSTMFDKCVSKPPVFLHSSSQ